MFENLFSISIPNLISSKDVSHTLRAKHPDLRIGRVDCSREIILSTRFIITKPPILYHITPATRTIRRFPLQIGRPKEIYALYENERWKQVSPWVGSFNPLGNGTTVKLMLYAGVAVKAYTRAVDRIPFVPPLNRYAVLTCQTLGGPCDYRSVVFAFNVGSMFIPYAYHVGIGFMERVRAHQQLVMRTENEYTRDWSIL